MLSQRLKENNKAPDSKTGNKKSVNSNMLYQAIQILKKQQEEMMKDHKIQISQMQAEKQSLKVEINHYKNKVAELSQANLLYCLVAKNVNSQPEKQEKQNYELKKMTLQAESLKDTIKEKQLTISQLRKQAEQSYKKHNQLVAEKQKNMEISLLQKISLEQRIQLIQKQNQGKRRVIEGLKKQIDRIAQIQKQVLKKEQKVQKGQKDMQKSQREFQSYYQHSEKMYQSKIKALENQNRFLHKQFKKIMKNLKASCKCEGEAEIWKQKLYQVGRELAQARVQLGRIDFQKKSKGKNKTPKQPEDSDDSIGSLTLSQQSSEEALNLKKQTRKQ